MRGAGKNAGAFRMAALNDGFQALFFKNYAGDEKVVNSGDLVFKGSTCVPLHPFPSPHCSCDGAPFSVPSRTLQGTL
jgi:hypothetical protein